MSSSANVTLYTLSLGDRDSTTGWCAKEFDAGSTIKMVIVPKGSRFLIISMGYFAYESPLGFTAEAVEVGDEIKDATGVYCEIKDKQKVMWLNQFVCWKCNLEELPLHG